MPFFLNGVEMDTIVVNGVTMDEVYVNGVLVYTASSPWDLTNGSYVSEKSVAAQSGNVRGIYFRDDGSRMFISVNNTGRVYEYPMSIDWQVSSASYNNNGGTAPNVTAPDSLTLDDTGDNTSWAQTTHATDSGLNSHLWTSVIPTTGSWDFGTADSSGSGTNLDVSGEDTAPVDLQWRLSDMKRFFMLGETNNTVYQYTTTLAFNLSAGSYDSNSFSFASQDSDVQAICFSPDGTKMFAAGNSTNKIYRYELGTAWSLGGTVTYSSNFLDVSAKATEPRGLFISDDGTHLFVSCSATDKVYEYKM
jgi:hypothetical protein